MRRAAETIINWEWLILLLLLPFLLFPTEWRAFLLLVIPLLWFIRKIGTGQFIPDTPFDSTILVLLTGLLISLAAVFNMEFSFPKIAGLIMGIALFYGAVQYNRNVESGEYHLLALIIVAGSGMALAGTLSIFNSLALVSSGILFDRLPAPVLSLMTLLGDEVNPNEIAGVLSWLLPLLAAVTFGFWSEIWRSGRWSLRLLHLVMIGLLLANSIFLLATRSRGGNLSVVLAILLMLAIRYRWGRWFLLVVVIGTIALGFFFDLGGLLIGSGQSATDFGLQGRLDIWSRAIYGLADFPLTGMGMNGFRQVVHVLYPLLTVSPTVDLGHAHNHLLQAGLDLGILGLIAYLSIWIISGALLWIGWKKLYRHTDRVLIVGLSGSLVAGWAFGVFDAIALGARPGFLWWLLIGLLVATFDNVRFYSPIRQSEL